MRKESFERDVSRRAGKMQKGQRPQIGGCLFCVIEKEYHPYPDKVKHLGSFPILAEPGKISESWRSVDA